MHNNFKISLLGIALGMSLLHSSHAAPLLAGQDQPIAQAAKIPAANAWLEIDRQAFADNLRTLQKTLQPQTQMCAVMKADAYGAGIDLLMPAILETQTPCVGITSNAEAAIVRQHGFTGRIMRLRAATNEEIIDALPLQIDELLGNYEQAQAMSKLLQQQNQLLNFHLALNSGGIDRNGLDVSDNKGMKQAVAMTHLPHLKPVGIMTHYAVEDENYVRAHLKTF